MHFISLRAIIIFLVVFSCNCEIAAAAASANDVLEKARSHMDEAAWLELGSTAWAESLEKAAAEFPDIERAQNMLVQMHIAEAYLAARRSDKSATLLDALAQQQLSAEMRFRLA